MMTGTRQSKHGSIHIKNMGVCHDLCLQTDILLLTDVLEYLGTRVPSIMD